MTRNQKMTFLVVTSLALQACAILPKALKAPCGPQASLVGHSSDPCSNRKPINKDKVIVLVLSESFEKRSAI